MDIDIDKDKEMDIGHRQDKMTRLDMDIAMDRPRWQDKT